MTFFLGVEGISKEFSLLRMKQEISFYLNFKLEFRTLREEGSDGKRNMGGNF